ncbi:36130_t:CDS:1, partial [Racocetra persica]
KLRNSLGEANKIVKSKSKALKESKEFEILDEEIKLYSAYLDNDLNRISNCVQFFKKNNAIVSEFRAINLWLQTPKSIQIEYWNEKLQYLLRICNLTFPFIAPCKDNANIEKVRKGLENFFFIREVKDRKSKRKILPDSPLLDLINEAHQKNN